MAVFYNPRYNSISDIKGPSGWYWINTSMGPVHTYVNQTYDGGGWVLVLANRQGTGGMKNLTYNDAVSKCVIRSGTSDATNTTVAPGAKLSSLANYNVWIGPAYWSLLAGRATASKVTVVQFVSNTNGTALNGTHLKRYRWRFDSFNSTYAMTGATAVSDETATGAPDMYAYHAANSFSLSAFDRDQDTSGSNCSTNYNNNPWWYGSCWSGNYFAGGAGYQDGPYWTGSGSDYYQYGAVYIK